jgi:hypothetical protein
MRLHVAEHACGVRCGEALLLCVVELKHAARGLEVKDDTVDDQFVFSGVWGDLMNVLDFVAVGSKLLKDKVDVYHAGQCTGKMFSLASMLAARQRSAFGLCRSIRKLFAM